MIFVFCAIILISSIVVPTVILIRKKHKPIVVQSDEDFLKYNFQGSGTAGDPFIIENYEIKTNKFYAIAITNVSKSFIIRNNHLQTLRDGIFIAISSPDLVIIKNNTFDGSENGIGVKVWDTSGCQIINNTFKNSGVGVAMMCLSSSISWMEGNIINNTFINIVQDAIMLFKINKAVIEENKCIYDENYEESDKWKRGFFLFLSGNITLKKNNLSKTGIAIVNDELETYLSHTVENNIVNGKEFGYFVDLNNEIFDSTEYSQLYFINCSFIDVRLSFFKDCSLGINYAFCVNCNVSWNFFDRNYYGLYVTNSLEINITNNTFKEGRYGCFIVNSTYHLFDNIYLNNEQDKEIRD